MQSNYETLRLERISEHVLLVTMDRPEVANAHNTQMGLELRDLWTGLYVDQQDLRCVVVTGAGDKAFSAGGDREEEPAPAAPAAEAPAAEAPAAEEAPKAEE